MRRIGAPSYRSRQADGAAKSTHQVWRVKEKKKTQGSKRVSFADPIATELKPKRKPINDDSIMLIMGNTEPFIAIPSPAVSEVPVLLHSPAVSDDPIPTETRIGLSDSKLEGPRVEDDAQSSVDTAMVAREQSIIDATVVEHLHQAPGEGPDESRETVHNFLVPSGTMSLATSNSSPIPTLSPIPAVETAMLGQEQETEQQASIAEQLGLALDHLQDLLVSPSQPSECLGATHLNNSEDGNSQ